MAGEAQTSTAQSQHPEPNPGPSRQQAMLYGIVGGALEEVTRRVPIDEPVPLGENSTLKSIGKPIQRLGHAYPVLRPARALLARIPLGLRPSLHRLRNRSPGVVRRLPRYYGGV